MSLMLEALEQRQAMPAADAATNAPPSTAAAAPEPFAPNVETAPDMLSPSAPANGRKRLWLLGGLSILAVLGVSAGTAIWRAQAKSSSPPVATFAPALGGPGGASNAAPGAPGVPVAPGAPGAAAPAVVAQASPTATSKVTPSKQPGASPTAQNPSAIATQPNGQAATVAVASAASASGTAAAVGPSGDAAATKGVPAKLRDTPTAAAPARNPGLAAPTTPAVRLQRVVSDDTASAAWAAAQRGDATGALEQYRRVLARQPDDVDALAGAASLLHRRGDRENAHNLYRRALAVRPDHAGATAGILNLMGESDPATAESRLKDFMESHSADDTVHATLGQLLARQGRWSEAQASFFQAHTMQPDRAHHAYNLAVALDRLHQPRPALTYYRLALSLPQNGEVPLAKARQRIETLSAPAAPTEAAPTAAAAAATPNAPPSWWRRLVPTTAAPEAPEAQ